MKYINRWGLMRSTYEENLSEHSLEVAIIAHALAVIRNTRFGGAVNAERAALLGVYHDCSEIITGDLPTPIKYHNKLIRNAYKDIENSAQEKLLNMLPSDIKKVYKDILTEQDKEKELWQIVKAADKLSALIKCTEELRMGNQEFSKAKTSILKSIHNMDLPEIKVFLEEMLPAYSLTLDELKIHE